MAEEYTNTIQSRLQDFLAFPREDLDVELKCWLDPAIKENQGNYAQAILALANHGGGHIIVGFQESNGAWSPDPKRPANLKQYSQDTFNSIVQMFAEPAFHCHVHHIEHPDTGDAYPIIVVPGGHRVPIRCKADGSFQKHARANQYYIRRPGPKSEQIQVGKEWDDLINRCVRMAREDLISEIRSILFGIERRDPVVDVKRDFDTWLGQAKDRFSTLVQDLRNRENPDRYAHGYWIVAYKIVAEIQPCSLADFRDMLRDVDAHITGWPVWTIFNRQDFQPYKEGNVLEAWFMDANARRDASSSDFWRASPTGLMFLLRGYDDDGEHSKVKPGTALDPILPIWRLGECLLHAARLARVVATSSAPIIVQAEWHGLQGRELQCWTNIGRYFGGNLCRTSAVTADTETTADQIETNLPEVAANLLKPLYESFSLFKMPSEVIRGELAKMSERDY